MSCKYCELKIGSAYNFTSSEITCIKCGNNFPSEVKIVKYHLKKDNEHYFDVLDDIYCSECGIKIVEFILPCGGSYYFNESEISESLLLPQEFFIKK